MRARVLRALARRSRALAAARRADVLRERPEEVRVARSMKPNSVTNVAPPLSREDGLPARTPKPISR